MPDAPSWSKNVPWWKRLTAVFGGSRSTPNGATAEVVRFRADVQTAVTGSLDHALLAALLGRPAEAGLPEEDVELELEILHGALDLLALQEQVGRAGLPLVPHQHKALAGERCHFAASAFLASDATQRTGRLFLTDKRLVFLAVPLISLPWGAIARTEEDARDVIVAAPGRGALHSFRCNSFSDARCVRWVAEALRSQKPQAEA